MPAQTPQSPVAPPTTPNGQPQPAFFVNQQMAPASRNISESPVLSTPQNSGGGKSSAPAATKQKKPFNKKIFLGLGAAVVILLIIGGGAGLYLTQTQQDTRQQASTPTGTARITLSPASGTLKGGTTQSVPISLDLSSTPVSLTELTFVIALSGQIPTDLKFQPETLTGFNPADVSLTDASGGKMLSVSYKVPSGGTYTSSAAKISIGSLQFTNLNSGQLILRFQASDSKAIVKQSGADILRPPSLITYTFQSSATPTPLQNEVVTASNSAAAAVASSSASTSASSSARTSTGLPNAGGIGGATESATVASTSATPTRTPTPTTSSRSSSQPATTQEKPVSGSVENTYALIGLGTAFILFGLRQLKKKPKVESPE